MDDDSTRDEAASDLPENAKIALAWFRSLGFQNAHGESPSDFISRCGYAVMRAGTLEEPRFRRIVEVANATAELDDLELGALIQMVLGLRSRSSASVAGLDTVAMIAVDALLDIEVPGADAAIPGRLAAVVRGVGIKESDSFAQHLRELAKLIDVVLEMLSPCDERMVAVHLGGELESWRPHDARRRREVVAVGDLERAVRAHRSGESNRNGLVARVALIIGLPKSCGDPWNSADHTRVLNSLNMALKT